MVKIRERFHKAAFLITRILSLVISLAWLGLAFFFGNVLYEEFANGSLGGSTIRNVVIQPAFIGPVIFIGIPCLIHILLSIFIQQRKKWAVASMFVFTAIELGSAIAYFIVFVQDKYFTFPAIVSLSLILLFGVFIYVLAESYIAINLEKVSQKGFEVVKSQSVIPVMPDSAGRPPEKAE